MIDELWRDPRGAMRRLFAERLPGQEDEDATEFDEKQVFVERLALRAFGRWLQGILHAELTTAGPEWSRLKAVRENLSEAGHGRRVIRERSVRGS